MQFFKTQIVALRTGTFWPFAIFTKQNLTKTPPKWLHRLALLGNGWYSYNLGFNYSKLDFSCHKEITNFETEAEFIVCYCFCFGQQSQLISWEVNSQVASRWQLWFKFCKFPNQYRIFVLCLIKKFFIKICLKLYTEHFKIRMDDSVR